LFKTGAISTDSPGWRGGGGCGLGIKETLRNARVSPLITRFAPRATGNEAVEKDDEWQARKKETQRRIGIANDYKANDKSC